MLQGLAGFWGKLHDSSVCLGLVGVFLPFQKQRLCQQGCPLADGV